MLILENKKIHITVAVVCYNHGPKFHSCIDSILRQTYDGIDLVVVDDFSCDFDGNEAEAYIRDRNAGNLSGVSVEKFPEHRGPVSAYRRALELARGEYILFIGGDDCLASRTVLEEAAEKLAAEKTDILQGRGVFQLREKTFSLPSRSSLHSAKAEMLYEFIHASKRAPSAQILCIQAAFFRVSTLREMDAFPSHYHFSVDWPLYMQLLLNGASLSVTSTVVSQMYGGGPYRKDSVGTVYIKKGYLAEAAQAVREYAIEKRRESLPAEEILRLESAAESLETFSVFVFEWHYFSLEDRIRWLRSHREWFAVYRAVRPDANRHAYPIKRLFFVLVAVFLLGVSFMALSGGAAGAQGVCGIVFFAAAVCFVFYMSSSQSKLSEETVERVYDHLKNELPEAASELDRSRLQSEFNEIALKPVFPHIARFLLLMLACAVCVKSADRWSTYTVLGIVFALCALAGALAVAEKVARKLRIRALMKRFVK